MREAVYQRARAALGRQLTAVDPPLSTREIEAQHQELEDAIGRLEADYAPSDPAGSAFDSAESEGLHPSRHDGAASGAAAASTLASDRSDGGSYDSEEETDDEDEYEDEGRRSRVPLLIGLVVLLAVLGIAVYGYTQRETVLASFGFSDADEPAEDDPPIQVVTPVQQSLDAPSSPPEDAGPDKRLDRLTNGPETPPEPGPADAEPPQVATLPGGEPPADPLGALAEGEGELPLPPAEPPPAEVAPGEPAAAPQQQAAVDPAGQSIVAQRAIYYFQGTEGQPGRAAEGNVTWTQITRDDSPAVQAILRLKDQDVVTTVTVSKNSDANLPASHLVEVQFSGALGPSPVQRVPALVLKQTEQARGQPLTGAAVPVTADLFWIALADDADQAARNLQLLRQGSWFDIPILFNDGTRALLTFEKGIPGDRIFETVLAAWTPT